MTTFALPTLLVITDNPSIRFWIKKHLEEEFFIVDVSKQSAAVAAAQSTLFDFIVVDSELEDCDPIELCNELKQILRTLTPILLITGRLKRNYLNAAREAGVTDFLNNQLDLEEFREKIALIRKGRSLRDKTQGLSSALAQTQEDRSGGPLKNRVVFHNQALKVLKEAQAEGVSISALMIRIDRFSELQQQASGAVLAKVMSSFANLLRKFLTQTDTLIQSSEESFIVFMKNKTLASGRTIAEQMRKEIAKTPFQIEKGSCLLTVSIVVSSLEGTESDLNRMVDSSFKALKTAQDLIISIDEETP